MAQEHEIEFYFMPFPELELSGDIPIVAYMFENQRNSVIDSNFPEIGKLWEDMEKNEELKDNVVSFFPIQRDGRICMVGIVYIGCPWKKKKFLAVGDINLYAMVRERTAVMVKRLRALNYKEAIILLPGKFYPRNIKNNAQRGQLLLFVQTLTESIVVANAVVDEFKRDKRPLMDRVTFTYFGEYDARVNSFFQKAIVDGHLVGEALAYTRHLIELPPNSKNPSKFVEHSVGLLVQLWEIVLD